MINQQFTLPNTIQSKAAQVSSRTRKLGEKFEAICAVYFLGNQVSFGRAIGRTRYLALKAAEKAAKVNEINSGLMMGSRY